jgi:hypothetical protein
MASGRKPGIMVSLGLDFVEIEAGKAVFTGTPGEHAYNPIGAVQAAMPQRCWIPPAAALCIPVSRQRRLIRTWS